MSVFSGGDVMVMDDSVPEAAAEQARIEPEPERHVADNVPEPEPLPSEDTGMGMDEKARLLGHVPKEEWKGKPEDWVDAETYVKKSETNPAMLRNDRERLFKAMEETNKAVSEMRKLYEDDRENIRRKEREAAKKEYEAELTALRAAQEEAVLDGNIKAYREAEERRKALEDKNRNEPEPKPAPAAQQAPDPVFVEWHKENKWYDPEGKDEASLLANSIGRQIAMNPPPGMTHEKALKQIEAIVSKAYPHVFANPRRESPAGAESPSGIGDNGKPSRQRSISDLPPANREQFARLSKHGMTKDQYLAIYYEDKPMVMED